MRQLSSILVRRANQQSVDGEFGELPDGTLNIWIPGTPPSRWCEARSPDGELRYICIDYEVEGRPKPNPDIKKLKIGAETDDGTLTKQPAIWIKEGLEEENLSLRGRLRPRPMHANGRKAEVAQSYQTDANDPHATWTMPKHFSSDWFRCLPSVEFRGLHTAAS